MPDGSGSFLLWSDSATTELPRKNCGICARMTLTEMNNLGEFVAASLDLNEWQRDMSIGGPTIRSDELLLSAQRITSNRVKTVVLTRKNKEKEL